MEVQVLGVRVDVGLDLSVASRALCTHVNNNPFTWRWFFNRQSLRFVHWTGWHVPSPR